MLPFTPDLFDEAQSASPQTYADAFDAWLQARERQGGLREASSVAVYRSMWTALTQWCVARGLHLDRWQAGDLQAFLLSRGHDDELTARHAWRLLMLADAVQTHRAQGGDQPRNTAAHALLMSTPEWRYANAADKTPLPEHLHAAQARSLVAWLMDMHGEMARSDGLAWQSLRNRTAVALQLGAGLTPGDIRACTVDGVVSHGAGAGARAGMPWKVRLPAHGSAPAREAPLAPWAARLLRTWLDTRCALQMAGPVLFPATRAGRPWGKVAQYSAAKAVLTAAGVPDSEGGSFKLRHTFALRQLRRGSAPEDVAQWMGLSNVAALARYQRVLVAPADVV